MNGLVKRLFGKPKNEYVEDKFLEESKRWRDLFIESFNPSEYSNIKLNRAKNFNKLRVSPPLVRQHKHIIESGKAGIIEGGLVGNLGSYEILSVFRGYASNRAESDFTLGYPSDGGLRQPVFVKTGKNIINFGSENLVCSNYNCFEDNVNDLAEDYRRTLNDDSSLKEFFLKYLELCDRFASEFKTGAVGGLSERLSGLEYEINTGMSNFDTVVNNSTKDVILSSLSSLDVGVLGSFRDVELKSLFDVYSLGVFNPSSIVRKTGPFSSEMLFDPKVEEKYALVDDILTHRKENPQVLGLLGIEKDLYKGTYPYYSKNIRNYLNSEFVCENEKSDYRERLRDSIKHNAANLILRNHFRGGTFNESSIEKNSDLLMFALKEKILPIDKLDRLRQFVSDKELREFNSKSALDSLQRVVVRGIYNPTDFLKNSPFHKPSVNLGDRSYQGMEVESHRDLDVYNSIFRDNYY